MIKKLIIFDFDGVLADSFDTFYPLIKACMKQIGLSLTPNQYRNFFIGNVHQGFKDFIKEEKKYSAFSKFRNDNYDRYYYDKKLKAKLFPEVTKFIKKISKEYILTIASSGKQDNIKNLLTKNGIGKFFSLIIANSAISKESMIEKILNKYHAKPEETLMVTDTVGDIKVAKKRGLATMAVSWGFHSPQLLRMAEPDYVIKNFKELQRVLLNTYSNN